MRLPAASMRVSTPAALSCAPRYRRAAFKEERREDAPRPGPAGSVKRASASMSSAMRAALTRRVLSSLAGLTRDGNALQADGRNGRFLAPPTPWLHRSQPAALPPVFPDLVQKSHPVEGRPAGDAGAALRRIHNVALERQHHDVGVTPRPQRPAIHDRGRGSVSRGSPAISFAIQVSGTPRSSAPLTKSGAIVSRPGRPEALASMSGSVSLRVE